jgi:serine/threonine protein kinase
MDRTTTAPRWQKGNMILDPFTNESRWEIYDIKMGGMGIVYVVYDHKFHEPFAAKTFRDEVVRDKPHIADLFLQEALAWVNLDFHQNVTQARFVKYLQGKPFVFLEYVSGGDLESWIYDKHLPDDIPQTLRFAIQFCDGMIHAISKAITAHRDVKPANCLITHDSTLKVTDFGMAKSIAADKRHGGRGGTDPYMSPEQWDDFMGVDVRADIYSFGVMLFEMVTGQWPFNGRTRQEFEHLHRTQNPPSLKSKIRDLTPEISRLESVIQTCLQKGFRTS